MHLDEEPLDIGYASEKIIVSDYEDNELQIGGQNGKSQLFITLPDINDIALQELATIKKDALNSFENCNTYVITSQKTTQTNDDEKLQFLLDSKGELGDFYGTRIADGDLAGRQTKALILISKDGAIFYDEFLSDLTQPFNIETLYRKLKAADECYTGKGCH